MPDEPAQDATQAVRDVPNADAYGQAWAKPTAYVVCAVPESDDEYDAWSIRVEYRGHVAGQDRWAICHHRSCMDANGNWEYEPSNSNRTEEYNTRFRFDLDTALTLAKQHAPAVTVNGNDPAGLLAWRRSHSQR